MDLSQIRELLKIVAESGVAEVEIEEENFKLVVRRDSPNVSIQPSVGFQAPPFPYYPPPSYGPPPVIPTPFAESAPAPQAAAPPASSDESAPEPPKNDHIVKAPIVGTFYSASSPEAAPFVQVGDTVKPGDVLCIIEAMKLMNEIECEVAGAIKEILISNAEPVEYDQPLFVIAKS